jgi:hypothetical protein
MNIRELAEQAGIDEYEFGYMDITKAELDKFAELVAAHTLMNIDPKSFMTYHEGYAAGVAHGREECANICDANGLFMTAREIRARSKA